jgi:hypothetical protein
VNVDVTPAEFFTSIVKVTNAKLAVIEEWSANRLVLVATVDAEPTVIFEPVADVMRQLGDAERAAS